MVKTIEEQREYQRLYYQQNKEKINNKRREYFDNNLEKVKEYQRKYQKIYRAINKEKISKYHKVYNISEKYKAYRRKYFQKNKIKLSRRNKPYFRKYIRKNKWCHSFIDAIDMYFTEEATEVICTSLCNYYSIEFSKIWCKDWVKIPNISF